MHGLRKNETPLTLEFFLILTWTRTSVVSDRLAGTFETLFLTFNLLKYLLSLTPEILNSNSNF